MTWNGQKTIICICRELQIGKRNSHKSQSLNGFAKKKRAVEKFPRLLRLGLEVKPLASTPRKCRRENACPWNGHKRKSWKWQRKQNKCSINSQRQFWKWQLISWTLYGVLHPETTCYSIKVLCTWLYFSHFPLTSKKPSAACGKRMLELFFFLTYVMCPQVAANLIGASSAVISPDIWNRQFVPSGQFRNRVKFGLIQMYCLDIW